MPSPASIVTPSSPSSSAEPRPVAGDKRTRRMTEQFAKAAEALYHISLLMQAEGEDVDLPLPKMAPVTNAEPESRTAPITVRH